MSCGMFEIWLVSEDPAERARAEDHARTCQRCRQVLDGQARLLEQVSEWAVPIEPPARLEQTIRSALRSEGLERSADSAGEDDRSALAHWHLWAGALAASLVIGLGIGLFQARWVPQAPEVAEGLLVVEALQEAAKAEREHARAIARLEEAAQVVLARAGNPEMPSNEAAILLAYRDRLAYLDATIEEIDSYVATNPGHPGARTTLLAAYKEKTEVLREVLALEERS